jgi:hypothetical protein
MAVTEFQSRILQLLAGSRIKHGESYVAGGLALNLHLKTSRISHDIDIFNDSQEALKHSWESDRQTLLADGYEVDLGRERTFFVEATVRKNGHSTDIQWAQDSAYRFFPLLRDDLMGLTLHPFDLAANKLLALVGRDAPRDWVDTIECCQQLQPLPYLAWAACGKDPGFSPAMILEFAARVRYNQVELDRVVTSDPKPDASALCRFWHLAIATARKTLPLLPPEHAGTCVATESGDLFRGSDDDLLAALAAGTIRFHEGRIGGAWPTVRG